MTLPILRACGGTLPDNCDLPLGYPSSSRRAQRGVQREQPPAPALSEGEGAGAWGCPVVYH